MAVFRVEKNANYTTMCNYHLWDQNLSLKAKGLLSLFTIFRFKYQDCLLRMFPRTALKTERYFCCSEARQVIQ